MAKSRISVAEYLVRRLADFGVEHLFTVPGDYSGAFLDVVDAGGPLTRIPVTNEWVAGYAADAYGRLRGTGAVCLTYGVGTFGVLNALAGSYVEEVPVALIIGSPSFQQRQVERHEGVVFHHSTGKLTADVESVKNVVVAREVVRSGRTAPAQIDRALIAALTWRRPVYIEVFANVWSEVCRAPEGGLAAGPLPIAPRAVRRAVEVTVERLADATVPVVWAGVEVQRFGLQPVLERILRATKLPWTTDLLGKSLLPENRPGFKGVFDGASAVAEVKDLFDASNCVLGLGNLVTDDFAYWIEKHYDNMILAYGNSVRIGRKIYQDVPLAAFMEGLAERLAKRAYRAPASAGAVLDRVGTPGENAKLRLGGALQAAALKAAPPMVLKNDADGPREDVVAEATAEPAVESQLSYDLVFERVRGWIDDTMVLLADTSIVLYSAAELPVNQADSFIAQAAWNSVGYTPGAAVGVVYAAEGKRAVVFCGDGGIQETVQALGDLQRSGRDAIVFVFNNAFYGIEQAFVDPYYYIPDKEGHRHPAKPFCLLHRWDYAKLPAVFGGGWGAAVSTVAELEVAMETARSNHGLSVIDVRLPQDSITPQMLEQAGVEPPKPKRGKRK